MATISDVARVAGVSVATVSRVINGSSAVKKSTSERVYDAIRQLSYTPNPSARNLRRKESRIIMILAPNFTNPYYALILSGICDTSRKLGYFTLVYNFYDNLTINPQVLEETINANKVDGTIALACNYNDYWFDQLKDTYPIVQCSEYNENSKLPHISVDNYCAAYDTVSYLIKLGHKRIGFVGSSNSFISTKLRYEGYAQALRDAKIPLNRDFCANGSADYSFQSGKTAARLLLSSPVKPSAIFCLSDVLALGVIAQAQEMGISVPDWLSVTGFDDVDYTTMFHPHLTTISIPGYELGCQTMFLLQKVMQKEKNIDTNIFLPHRLTIRESSGPIGRGGRGRQIG